MRWKNGTVEDLKAAYCDGKTQVRGAVPWLLHKIDQIRMADQPYNPIVVIKNEYNDGRILFVCTGDGVKYNVYMSTQQVPEIIVQGASLPEAMTMYNNRLKEEE